MLGIVERFVFDPKLDGTVMSTLRFLLFFRISCLKENFR